MRLPVAHLVGDIESRHGFFLETNHHSLFVVQVDYELASFKQQGILERQSIGRAVADA
jgi:hypothetical protein